MERQILTNMEMESLRYPSWCLSRLLDTIIGTKEEVDVRRRGNSMCYFTTNVDTSYNLLHSGSRGEGFAMSSSDIDLMLIDRNTVIQENIHDTRSIDDSKTTLLMRREGCNPGFVTLELLGTTNNRSIIESIVEYCSHSRVSSLLYRDQRKLPDYGQKGHGPCNTMQLVSGTDVDIAFSFKCDQWPTEANEFIYRHRCHGWPKKSLLDKIVCRGCHVVPIGDKISDLSYIQWRLSFSAAEKDIVHSFNHAQFLVYGLLKIFLKKFINKFYLVEGILCSYFLKTAMFYSIESSPSSLWRDDFLIPCFWLCMNKLITWVEQGYCPNYFVQRNNMFRNKVFGEYRQNLLCVLDQCKHIGWTCIYLCEDMQNLRDVVSHPTTLYRNCPILSKKEQESSLDIVSYIQLEALIYHFDHKIMHKYLARLLTLFCYSRAHQEQEYSTLLLQKKLMWLGHFSFCNNNPNNNKGKYKTLRSGKYQRLSFSSLEDYGFSELFHFATFYHKNGQYLKAIHVLERVLSIWKPYVLYRSFRHKIMYHHDLYQHYVCGRGCSLNDKVRYAHVCDISIDSSTKLLSPSELCHDVEASDPFPLYIPPLPYAVFLLFLCYHKLGNIDRSLSVLHDLRVLALDKIQGCGQNPVVLNMMAICLNKLSIKHGAVELCLLSQELKPDRNGAGKLLDKILSTWC